MDQTIKEEEPLSFCVCKKQRYVVVTGAFMGMVMAYMIRVNMSVTVVQMRSVDPKTNKSEFSYTTQDTGYILSSYFWGYISTQFFGGWMGMKIGGPNVLGIGVGLSALVTLFCPLCAYINIYCLIASRFFVGFFCGVAIPSTHAIWARWSPRYERSRMSSTVFAGTFIGTIISNIAAGFLCTFLGWESVFYIFGAIGLIWATIFLAYIREKPSKDPLCKEDEKNYIESSLAGGNVKIKHPWKKIFTSCPYYACIVVHFTSLWGFYNMLTAYPLFLKETMKFDVKNSGIISSAPYIIMTITLTVSGYLADVLTEKKIMSITMVRKLFNTTGFIIEILTLLAAMYIPNDIAVVTCITISIGIQGLCWSCFLVNYLDLYPPSASVMLGIANTFATIPGIVSPILTGYLVSNKGTMQEWHAVFYIIIGMAVFGCIIFIFFGSGDLQDWAEKEEDKK